MRASSAPHRGTRRSTSWSHDCRVAEAGPGPESVVPFVYNSSAPLLQDEAGERLWRRFGASRVRHTVCAATHGAAYHVVFGDMLSADPADVVHSQLVVVWGANPTVSNIHFPPLVTRAQREHGATVVVVDPRRTAMAARADLHLAVRPGTDVVLAYAVAAELERRELLATEFLAAHATGVEEFLAAAGAWPVARAAAVCGVPAADIERFAMLLGTVRPAMVRLGWGPERNRNGGSACVAVLALPVLAGQFGAQGSGVIGSLSSATPLAWDAREPDTPPDRRSPRAFGMNTFGAALCDPSLDPPIDVLFVQGSNLAATNPDQQAVLRGLARDDLFTVVHDQVLTDTARYADVVLPATTHFETHDLAASYGAYVLQETPPVIEPVGESRSNNELAAELARRLGYDLTRFAVDRAAVLERCRRDDGSYEGARAVRPPGGTVQFRDTQPSHADGRARLASMPRLAVPRYAPLDDTYPLTLITPATARTINSMFGEFQPADTALRLHPDGTRPPGDSPTATPWWFATIVPRSPRRSASTPRCVRASRRCPRGPGVATSPVGSRPTRSRPRRSRTSRTAPASTTHGSRSWARAEGGRARRPAVSLPR